MIKKNIRLLENARNCSKIARNICCLARKLLEIFTTWLGLARIFLENELLKNSWLEFYFPCSKSPIILVLVIMSRLRIYILFNNLFRI